MDKKRENYFLLFILIVFSLQAFLFFIGNRESNLRIENEKAKITEIQKMLTEILVKAKAFSIYDGTLNEKIYGRNDDVKMPIASLAKIMTVIVALRGHSVNDIVLISPDALKQENDYGFFAGEKFEIGDLAQITLISSANDGAYALAENDDNFLQKMNEKARRIGLENTSFLNFTGLDIDKKTVGAYASAKDVNVMAIYALKAYPEIFGATALPEISVQSESGFAHRAWNTNIILDKIPGLLFSKTGFTPLAGGSLCVIFKDRRGHDIAVTVLGSTEKERFSDMEKIINLL